MLLGGLKSKRTTWFTDSPNPIVLIIQSPSMDSYVLISLPGMSHKHVVRLLAWPENHHAHHKLRNTNHQAPHPKSFRSFRRSRLLHLTPRSHLHMGPKGPLDHFRVQHRVSPLPRGFERVARTAGAGRGASGGPQEVDLKPRGMASYRDRLR